MKLRYLLMVALIAALTGCGGYSEKEHNEQSLNPVSVANQQKKGHKEGDESRGHDQGKAIHQEGNEKVGHDKRHESEERHGSEARGEHARDVGERGEGEEDGTSLSLTQKYDKTKNGIRLILSYDKDKNAFVGTVQNVTRKKIDRVRIEVHLSNGKELGPTRPINLGADTKRKVELRATSTDFDGWSTHAEVGNSEHGSGKEETGEHDREEKGEHNQL